MRVLSLFSGGGLGDYGLTLAGMEIVGQVEIDDYCQKILKLRWPDVPKWTDIKNVRGEEVIEKCGRIDLISGGFPCQPFSIAGKQRGKQDDRYLWPQMLRVISEIKPAFVLGENVPGIIRTALDQVLSDLEGIGYTCQAFTIPACAVDAPHKRDRVWILGYAEHFRQYAAEVCGSFESRSKHSQTRKKQASEPSGSGVKYETMADSEGAEQPRRRRTPRNRRSEFGCSGGWPTEPEVCRVDDGSANRVDRLKLLGNGQVVQVVEWIGKRIMEFEAATS